MGSLLWRMPSGTEPPARLSDLTVAEVAEALEAPLELQLRKRVDKDVLAVYSVTAAKRSPAVLLYRDDDSFIWRVAVAQLQSAAEFESWIMRVR